MTLVSAFSWLDFRSSMSRTPFGSMYFYSVSFFRTIDFITFQHLQCPRRLLRSNLENQLNQSSFVFSIFKKILKLTWQFRLRGMNDQTGWRSSFLALFILDWNLSICICYKISTLISFWKTTQELPCKFIRGHSKSTFIEGSVEGVIEKLPKTNRGRILLAFVYVRFFKKNAKVLKRNFYSYSPVFPIDYNGSMKY